MAGRQKSDEKREAIIRAASEEFSKRDFHEVLMDEIASRAGVGKGTLYRYFPAKEELLLATVVRGLADSSLDDLEGAEDRPLEEFLQDIVERMLGYFQGREGLLTLLQRYEHRLRSDDAELMQQRRDATIEGIAGAIANHAPSDSSHPLDTHLAAQMLVGMVRTAVLYTNDKGSADTAEMARAIVSLFMNGIRPPQTAAPRAPRRKTESAHA